MKLAFSTLGCPEWNLDQLVAAARESGYEGVEWRGYLAEMDLPKSAVFAPAVRGETRQRFREAGLEFASLGSSVRLADPAPEARRREKASFTEYAELAQFLGCPMVRVFGGNLPSGTTRVAALPSMSAFLRELAEIAAERGVTAILPTH